MPAKYAITFAASAVEDLEEIREWYRDRMVPEIADKIIIQLMASIERISSFPQSGRVVPEFNLLYLREIISAPFRIVYRIDSNHIRVVRVWRSERLLKIGR